MRTCSTCQAWEGLINAITGEFTAGECRRTSPQADASGAAVWPLTDADDGCHAHLGPYPDVDEMFARREQHTTG